MSKEKNKRKISISLDEKIIQELHKEKNKSKFINDLLLDYFFKKKENDILIINDNEIKPLNTKLAELKDLIIFRFNKLDVKLSFDKKL
jgi:hypothetical protein